MIITPRPWSCWHVQTGSRRGSSPVIPPAPTMPCSAEYVVRELNAHSWPEIYFPEIGWIEFEPTAYQPEIVRPEKEAEIPAVVDQPATQTQKFLFQLTKYQPALLGLSSDRDHFSGGVLLLHFGKVLDLETRTGGRGCITCSKDTIEQDVLSPAHGLRRDGI